MHGKMPIFVNVHPIKPHDMANSSRERIWKVTLIVLIVGLGLILFRQAQPYMSGVLCALTLYILLRRPTFRLAQKLGRPTLATIIVVIAVILFIVIPLTLIVWFVVDKIQQAEWNVNEIIAPATQMFDIIEQRFGIDLLTQETISFVGGKLTALGQSIIGGIGSFFINLLVALLLLFFLLDGGRKWEQYLASVIPMKNINKKETMEKVNTMVKSNAIGIPLVAILQGIIALIGYLIFNVPNAGLAAIATGFCSIVPIVGTMVVWVPLGVYFMVLGQWGAGSGAAGIQRHLHLPERQPAALRAPEEDGQHPSSDHYLRSDCRPFALRVHRNHLRTAARIAVPAIPGHVPQGISGRRARSAL